MPGLFDPNPNYGGLFGDTEDMRRLMIANALMSFGGGVLAGNRPGVTPGQAIGQGALSAGNTLAQYQQAIPQMQLRNMQAAKLAADIENERQQRQYINEAVSGGGPMAWARAFPQQYAQKSFESQFARPQTSVGQLLYEQAQLPPNDPRRGFYDAAIKKALSEGGFAYGSQGLSPIPGGPADPNYLARKEGAVAGAREAATLPYVGPKTTAQEAAKLPYAGLVAPGAVQQKADIAAAEAAAKLPYQPKIVPPGASVTTFSPGKSELGATEIYKSPEPAPGSQERAQSSTIGKFMGETYADLQKSGLAAPSRMAQLDRLGTLLTQTNTGKFAPTIMELKRSAKAAGIDLEAMGVRDDVAPAQAARAIAREIALTLRNPAAGAGMPGQLSNADRDFLESMIPGIEHDPGAITILIDYRKRLLKREQEVAKLARDYRKKKGEVDDGFFDEVEKYAEANPIFTAEDRRKAQGISDPLGLFGRTTL